MKKHKLKHIAPTLSKIKNRATGFEIPQGYFDEFVLRNKVFADTDALPLNSNKEFNIPTNYFESLEDIVIARAKAETMKGLNISEFNNSYFEDFEDRVIERFNKEKSKTHRHIKLRRFILPAAVAATVLLIFNIFSTAEINFEKLETADIESWIDTEADLDMENLLAVFENTELDDNLLISSISDEDMLEFLADEQLDEWLYEN